MKTRTEQKKRESSEGSSQMEQEVRKMKVETCKADFHQHLQPSQRCKAANHR